MTIPSFDAFFTAVHGYPPFPWQTRLAAHVVERGWPELLDIPTGAGKTSALDIALYALAAAPERMPRRVLLVVDRRIVVDQGAEQARAIRRGLRSKEPAALAIAARLRELWGAGEGEAPFAIAVMRGGMPRDNDWAKRPDQPVLGVSTIDQVGSRLLFRGYGISPRSASIHAGLIGNDTLILLDEVHLATAFAETLRSIRLHHRKPIKGLPERSVVVTMSATPGHEHAAQPFSLDHNDRAHPVLRQRLLASKPASLVQLDVRGDNEANKREGVAERAVKEALRLQSNGAKVIGLVVNRVDTARLAWTMLARHEVTTDRLLVTGRMRPIDRDRLVQTKLLPRAGASRDREANHRPIVVVATQCIEAGADLDFDGLVSECASLDALRQRFGRLDRRGDYTREHGAAAAVIVCRSDLASDRVNDPIYGTAMGATWKWLKEVATGDVVDLGIAALPSPLDDESNPRTDVLAPVVHAPVLLPAHLDAWAHTSPLLRPSPDPDPALWLHGPKRAGNDVQVVWRADLEATESQSGSLDEATAERLAAVRPSSLEAMSLPIHVVRAWLMERADASGMSDVLSETETEERDPKERAGEEAPRGRRYLLMGRDDQPQWTYVGSKRDVSERGDNLRPGDLILVPSRYGGINRDGSFDPEATAPVIDLGDLAQLRGRATPTLRMLPEVLVAWALPAATLAAVPKASEEETAKETKERVASWVQTWPESPPNDFAGTPTEWTAARKVFAKLRYGPRISSGDHLIVVEPKNQKLLLSDGLIDAIDDAVSEDDDSSFRGAEVALSIHSLDVKSWAKKFADHLGLGPQLAADLALAAWLHDVGKADPRFQRMLLGGDEARASLSLVPLAKSALTPGNATRRELAGQRAGYPAGYRHELLSLQMIQANAVALAGAHDRELVLHLVSSHHGWCRPFAPALDHPDDLTVTLDHDGVVLSGNTRHHLARLDSGVAERFWALLARYGWWGLAWLEAVVRLADHRASEQRERADLEEVAS
jgi:CRISPR-associated endonuclease/helicase Cas3